MKIKAFYYWLSGLIDGEGTFCICLRKTYTYKGKSYQTFQFNCQFSLGMSIKELKTLKLIKKELGFGYITFSQNNTVVNYRIYNKKDLQKLIDILDIYPLRSHKKEDYKLFKQAFKIISHRSLLRNNKGQFCSSLTQNQINTVLKIRKNINLTYNKKKSPGVRSRFNES